MTTKIFLTFAVLACLLYVACGGGSGSSSNSPNPPSPPTPGGGAAPSWTLVGNTGMAYTIGLIFDNTGTMYAASNGGTGIGGLAKSTNKGAS